MPDFARYLEAKRSVDERAIDRRVWDRLKAELPSVPTAPLAVADVGSGTGASVERLLRWTGLPPDALAVTVVEPKPELAERARGRASALGLRPHVSAMDLLSFAALPSSRERFDLVVAQAVLDIVELDRSLESLLAIARPGGLLYLPITFDGETIFEPAHPYDEEILAAYHRSMRPSGHGRVGRQLYHASMRAGAEVLELGSSDWIVHPRGRGYPEDEAFFLRHILDTVENAVSGRVSEAVLSSWSSARRRQVEDTELVFIAHQLDALVKKRA